MTDNPYVSIVVSAFNDKNSLKKLIPSLLEQIYPSCRYEIIIVDDGSDDGIRKLIESYQNIQTRLQYFFQGHKGPAAARNLGVKYSRGNIVAFIDSDCMAAKGWIDELVNGFKEAAENKMAGVGGDVRMIQEGENSLLSDYGHYIYGLEIKSRNNDKGESYYFTTANIAFRKDVFDLIGGFDEKFNLPGGEDMDLCYRLRAEGYQLRFNSKAVVFHRPKKTVFRLLKRYYCYGKGDFFISMRNGRIRHCIYTGIKAFLSFTKIPREVLRFYGKGLGIKYSLSFAILDCLRKISFSVGIFIGYFMVKYVVESYKK